MTKTKLLSDLHIIRQMNHHQTFQQQPEAGRAHHRRIRVKICNKNIKIFVKQQKTKINAKPQPSLTKSMPTVDCYSKPIIVAIRNTTQQYSERSEN